MEKVRVWLRRRSLAGLLVAYALVSGAFYVAIWTVIEPMGIPERIDGFPPFVSNRWLIHVALTLLLATPLTLVLIWWLFRVEGGVHKQLYQMKLDMLRELRRMVDRSFNDVKVGLQQQSHSPKDFHVRAVKDFEELRIKLTFFNDIARYCDQQCSLLLEEIMQDIGFDGDNFIRSLETNNTDQNTITGIESRVTALRNTIDECERNCLSLMRNLGYL